jgi:hypothetical protein
VTKNGLIGSKSCYTLIVSGFVITSDLTYAASLGLRWICLNIASDITSDVTSDMESRFANEENLDMATAIKLLIMRITTMLLAEPSGIAIIASFILSFFSKGSRLFQVSAS